MDVRVTVDRADDPGHALGSLKDWLDNEAELRGRVRAEPGRPGAGELGAVGDTLQVALGAGGAAVALAAALRTWLAQPRRSDVRIVVKGRGRSYEIDAKRVPDAAAIIDALARLTDDDADGAP